MIPKLCSCRKHFFSEQEDWHHELKHHGLSSLNPSNLFSGPTRKRLSFANDGVKSLILHNVGKRGLNVTGAGAVAFAKETRIRDARGRYKVDTRRGAALLLPMMGTERLIGLSENGRG